MKRFLPPEKARYLVFGIGVAVLSFVGWRFYKDWRLVAGVIRNAQYGFIALSLLLVQFSLVLFTGAWHLLMVRLANAKNAWQNVQFYCLSSLAKNLPTPVWYVAGRVHFYGQAGYPRSAAIAGSFIELALHGLTGLLALAGLEMLTSGFQALDLLYALVFVPLIYLFWKPNALSFALRWWQRRKGGSVHCADMSRWDLARLVVLYLASWINGLPFLYFIARGLVGTGSWSWPSLWRTWLVSSLLGYVAVLLGGLGLVREASLSVLLSSIMPFSVALVVAASSRLLLIAGEVIWCTCCIWVSGRILLRSAGEGAIKRQYL